jgi:hypothetical protein
MGVSPSGTTLSSFIPSIIKVGKKSYKIYSISSSTLSAAENSVCSVSKYKQNLDLIEQVFKRFPDNTDKSIVAMKIALVDTLDATHLSLWEKSIAEIADVIVSYPNIDKALKSNPVKVTEDLIGIVKKKLSINFFSFFSKYCFYHERYVNGSCRLSKYDTIVSNVLPLYLNNNGIVTKQGKSYSPSDIEKLRGTGDYPSFNNLIEELASKTGIANISNFRELLDFLMWYPNR